MSGKTLLTTVTGEIFHPTRLYYRVYDQKDLLRIFGKLDCTTFDRINGRWVWLYQGRARRLQFRKSYSSIPKALQPIVLGAVFLRKEDQALIDLRSFDRAVKAVVFFDEHIPRGVAELTHVAVVNKCFEAARGPEPNFDAFFESEKLVTVDPTAFLEGLSAKSKGVATKNWLADLMRFMETSMQEQLPEIEKFPAHYYEDGIAHLKTALDMRETLAFEHWRGNPDFSMGDIIRKIT